MRQIFRLVHAEARKRAAEAVRQAQDGLIVEIRDPTRSLEQNALLWAFLTDISEQVVWYGKKLNPEDWKNVFTAALKRTQVVPGLDGGFVVLGQSTSAMTKKEFSDLLELMNAFAAERGVVRSDEVTA